MPFPTKLDHRYGVLISVLLVTFCIAGLAVAQQSAAPPTVASSKASASDFADAADEVLAQMSEITHLPSRAPLKKSLRSREQIRAHVIQEMNEDKNPAERYAGARSAEAFGLLPKGFDLDSFMIDLLTEQIAGLYDPKAHEFYVADWIPITDQRMVMAHELTHALEDQHFAIENWVKAARPNDDSELARDAVLEGASSNCFDDVCRAWFERRVDLATNLREERPDRDPAIEDRRGGFLAHASPVGGYSRQRARSDGD